MDTLQADRIGETRYVRDDDLTRAAEVMLRHLPRHYGINALVTGPKGKKSPIPPFFAANLPWIVSTMA